MADRVLYSPPQGGSSNVINGRNAFYPFRRIEGATGTPPPDPSTACVFAAINTDALADVALFNAWASAETDAKGKATAAGYTVESVDQTAWAIVIDQFLFFDGASYVACVIWCMSINDISGNNTPGTIPV